MHDLQKTYLTKKTWKHIHCGGLNNLLMGQTHWARPKVRWKGCLILWLTCWRGRKPEGPELAPKYWARHHSPGCRMENMGHLWASWVLGSDRPNLHQIGATWMKVELLVQFTYRRGTPELEKPTKRTKLPHNIPIPQYELSDIISILL